MRWGFGRGSREFASSTASFREPKQKRGQQPDAKTDAKEESSIHAGLALKRGVIQCMAGCPSSSHDFRAPSTS